MIRTIALGVLLLMMSLSTAQPTNKYINDVVQPSPNEAALGKYGDIPVSYYTGIPSISVPIHVINQGPLSHNVMLNYHAGGIRGEDMASRVGLGWTLTAGGGITRTVNGFRDEDETKLGYYFYGHELSTLDSEEQGDLIDGDRDGEADMFSFNCGGYSGKFYIDVDASGVKTPVLVPKQDIVVSVTENDDEFESFLIITPDGNRHHFGKYNTTTAYTKTAPSSNVVAYKSTWHLLRTETYDRKHSLTFSYENDNYKFSSKASCRAYFTGCSVPGSSSYSLGQKCSTDSEYKFGLSTFAYTTTSITGKRLASISSTTETVSFISTQIRDDLENVTSSINASKSLDTIKISSGSGFCKKFTLDYDYFVDNAHTTDDNNFTIYAAKRLKLESVTETSCQGSDAKPPYTFLYNSPSSVRWRHSKAVDHWGFPNGQVNNNNFKVNIPLTYVGQASHGASDRSTHELSMLPGSLKKITYPTGGHTDLEYEANRYGTTGPKDSTLFKMANCFTPTPNNPVCCDSPTAIKYRTFTASELVNLEIRLWLTRLYDAGMCSTSDADISLKVYQGSSTTAIISEGYNITSIDEPLFYGVSMIFDNSTTSVLQPGVNYRFELIVENGWGTATIVDNQTANVDIKVGGLRVKEITIDDGIDTGTNNDIIKTYDYVDSNNKSSGQLYYEPTYAHSLSGFTFPVSNGSPTTVNSAVWSTTSFVPMSSYEANHIAYSRVVENHNGNGSNIFEYHTVIPTPSFQYPEIPIEIEVENGKEKYRATYAQGAQDPVAETTTDRVLDQRIQASQGSMYRVSEVLRCTGNQSGTVFMRQYNPFTKVYRVHRVTSVLDGVSSVVTNTYNGLDNYYAPSVISSVNSDGKTYHTKLEYPHQFTSGIKLTMKNLNLLIPIKSTTHVGASPTTANQIDGTETLYGMFHGFPYPQEYKRYERTYNSAGSLLAGDWVSQAVIDTYSSSLGLPTSVTIDGWDPETYLWEPSGLMKQRTFNNFISSYDYFSGTRLLERVTNVDLTSDTYTYDGLWRLKTTTNTCRDVTTTIDYNYGSPSGGNYIRTTTDYPSVANSALDLIINRNYIDGLGRSIQQIKEDQGAHSNQDVVTATVYDNQGRVSRQYEPEGVDDNDGDFITSVDWPYASTTYEPSPLNRPTATTHSAWNYPTTILYGNNDSLVNGIAINQLFKKTIIDPDLRESITYTDKRGRTVATVAAGSGGTAKLTTNYHYDDKDRVTMIRPPGAIASSSGLIFTYEYYGNDLVKFKKVPDAEFVEYRYNNRDLLIHYQDGHLRSQPSLKWMAYHYDDYGRQEQSGFRKTAFGNNIDIDPFPTPGSVLTIDEYYDDTQIHKDKIENHTWRVLNPDGTLGDIRKTNFIYDGCGRVEIQSSSHLLTANENQTGRDQHAFIYDSADNITLDDHQQYAYGAWTYTDKTQTIDFAGRPLELLHSFQNGTALSIARMTYNEKSLIARMDIGYKSGMGYLETCDYTYLDNQWLSSMNGSLFDYNMHYNSSPETPGQLQQNGNISEIDWQVLGGDQYAVGYKYDNYNRLENSYSKNLTNNKLNEYNTSYDYDDRGNITNLTRRGMYPGSANLLSNQLDNLDYTPISGSNRIKKIEDNASTSLKKWAAKGSSNEFGYDANGNMTVYPTKNATIDYNHLNLPRRVTFDNGGTIEFTYDADGNQLRKEVKQGSSSLEDRYYIGAAEYKDGALVQVMHDYGRIAKDVSCDQNQFITAQLATDETYYGHHIISNSSVVPVGNTVFKAKEAIILNEEFTVTNGKVYEAYIEACTASWQYEYALKDHLGNTRVVFSGDNPEQNANVSILQESHYYPFGMEMTGEWQNTSKHDYNYLYNGKELHKDFSFDMAAYGARFYDPSIGRFTSVDPMTEERNWLSPYNYVQNNPINRIDPDGAFDIIVNGVSYTQGATGEGESDFVKQTFAAINQLLSDPDAGSVSTNERSGHVILDFLGEDAIGDVEIVQGELFGFPHITSEDGTQINFSEDVGVFLQGANTESGESGVMSAATILGHEFGHAWLAQGSPSFNSLLERIDSSPHNEGASISQEHRWLTPLVQSFSRSNGEVVPKTLRSAAKNRANSVSVLGMVSDYFVKTLGSTSTKKSN